MFRCTFLFVLFVVAASAMTRRAADQEEPNPPENIGERCARETGFDRDLLNSSKHNVTMADIADMKTGCYMACVWKSQNLINEDGTIKKEEFIVVLPAELDDRETIVQIINDCTKEKGATNCETVSKALVCFKRSESLLDSKTKATFLRA